MHEPLVKVIVMLIFVVASLFNPLVIGLIFSNDGKISSIASNVVIIMMEVVLFFFGIVLLFKKSCIINKKKEILLVLSVVIVFILFMDLFFKFLLAFQDITEVFPIQVQNIIKQFYKNERNIIQYDPLCSRYDSFLSYTLKPGKCFFSNKEFRVEIMVNSLGLRDDEKSLDHPQIIFLGDSVSMGWGVGQNETYARIIENKISLRGLNMGISSYGTVREMQALQKINLSKVKYVVLQYSSNDVDENKFFYECGNLSVMSAIDYERIIKEYNKKRGYFPGKYVFSLFLDGLHYFDGYSAMHNRKNESDVEIKYFINALRYAGNLSLNNVKLFILVLDKDNYFVERLNNELLSGKNPFFLKNTTIINLNGKCDDCFYFLDGHPNVNGHKRIADLVLAALYT